MDCYEEDFYENCNEFDIEIDEFKKSLMSGVKKEFLDKMQSIQEENKKLQEIKDNWESLLSSCRQKENDLAFAIRNAKDDARSAKLSDLLEKHKLILYKATSEYIKKPKCNHCDEDRQLHFTTPEGRDARVSCDCNGNDIKYIPGEYVIYEFKFDGYDHQFRVWYKQITVDKNDEYFEINGASNYVDAKGIYKGEEYDVSKYYSTYFENKNDCEKYCNWLNENKTK